MNVTLSQLLIIVIGTCAAGADEAPQTLALHAPGGSQLALWQAAPNPNKPYIAQLFAPGGKALPLLDDSPPDHFHHHGLMFAISVDDTDFWGEKGIKNAGRQEPVGTKIRPDKSGFTRDLQWLATDGTVLLEESRQVQVRITGKGADAVHWLDWQSMLTPAAGRDAVSLLGDHYFGLGMRFRPAWSGKGSFLWQSTEGQKMVRGDEKLTPGQWCAACCEINDRPVTVLMIDHPGNARPVRWFTMAKPFCYLSAALGLDTDPARLVVGERWPLRYGIAVLAGAVDRARLEQLAKEWRISASRPATKQQPAPKP